MQEQDMTTVSENPTEFFQPGAGAASDDEAAIRALEERFAAAFNAGDVDAMMKNYIPDQSLVVFDVVPPRQHSGADAYRKAWVGFFAHFRITPKINRHGRVTNKIPIHEDRFALTRTSLSCLWCVALERSGRSIPSSFLINFSSSILGPSF